MLEFVAGAHGQLLFHVAELLVVLIVFEMLLIQRRQTGARKHSYMAVAFGLIFFQQAIIVTVLGRHIVHGITPPDPFFPLLWHAVETLSLISLGAAFLHRVVDTDPKWKALVATNLTALVILTMLDGLVFEAPGQTDLFRTHWANLVYDGWNLLLVFGLITISLVYWRDHERKLMGLCLIPLGLKCVAHLLNHRGAYPPVLGLSAIETVFPTVTFVLLALTIYLLISKDNARLNADLRRSSAKIEEWNRMLEMKIQLRTREIKEMNRRITSMYEITRKISASLEIRQLFEDALDLLMEAFPIQAAFIVLRQPDGSLSLECQRGFDQSVPEKVVWEADDETFFGRIFKTGRTVYIDDMSSQREQLSGMLTLVRNLKSCVHVPISLDGEVCGILSLSSRTRTGAFSPPDIRMLEQITGDLAMLLKNARLYEEVTEANKELKRLDELKSLFISMVSHELRTPLTTIHGYIEMIRTGMLGPVNDQQEKGLHVSERKVGQLAGMIEELLDHSRIEAGRYEVIREPADLPELVDVACQEFYPLAQEKEIRLTAEVDDGIPTLLLDEDKISQVFTNLLGNAVKHTAPRGMIKIIARLQENQVRVDIADSGEGIPADEQEKIFNRFHQVQGSSGRSDGLGLGLAITREIVNRHRGQIWVESEEGIGTTFSFTLPIPDLDEWQEQDGDDPS